MKTSELYLIFLLLFAYNPTPAQISRTIDSLQRVLKTNINNQRKVDVYNLLAEKYNKSDSAQVTYYSRQAMILAKKVGYKKGMANAYCNKGAVLWKYGNYPQARKYHRKALLIREQIGDKKGIADSYNSIGLIYFSQSNYPQALDFFKRTLNIRVQTSDKIGIAKSYNNIGLIYKNQGNYPQALAIYRQSLRLKKQLGNKKSIAKSYHNIGLVYYMKGDYPKALEFYQNSVRIKKQTKDKRGMAKSYTNTGLVYRNMGNVPKALEFFQKALRIKEQAGDKKGMAKSYHNIGHIYQSQGDYHKAMDFYQHSLKMKKQIGNKKEAANTYNSIGNIYRLKNNYPKALNNYKKALDIRKQIGDKSGIAQSKLSLGKLALAQMQFGSAKKYFNQALALWQKMGEKASSAGAWVNLGIAYYTQEKHAEAEIHLKKGIRIASKTTEPATIKEGAEYLTKIYKEQGDYKKAYENQTLFKKMADSLWNKKTVRQITQLEAQYAAQKQVNSLKLRQAQKEAKLNADIQQGKSKQNATYIGLGLSAALVLVLLFFYQSKQRNNRKLAAQNNLINLLLNENQHRVGNDFVAVYAKIAAIENAQSDEETRQLVEQAQKRVGEAMDLQNLLRYPFHAGEQNIVQTIIEKKLHTIAHTLYGIHFQETDQHTITIHNEVSSLDKNRFVMIGFCVFELVKNVCKHAFQGKSPNYPANIILSLHETQGVVTLRLQSNGKGFKPELFDETGEFNFKKHKISKGMSILQSITTREGGSFSVRTAGVHPEIQEGSAFVCTFG